MLLARPSSAPACVLTSQEHAAAATATWIDLLDPTGTEWALAEQACGFRVPTLEALNEIESSSRFYNEGEVLYLSVPLIRRKAEDCTTAPLGIVVSPTRMLTVRYLDYSSFDTFGHLVEHSPTILGAHDLLVGLLEAIVDRLADVLEFMGGELDRTSRRIFRSDKADRRAGNAILRTMLREIGQRGDTVSMIRDGLLGLSRMVLFLEDTLAADADPKLVGRLRTLGRDVHSLSEFDGRLTEKVQFLLDATLGFINIDQNNGIRVLTVVSIIGVPPTLIASIYGMNFKDMPELNWSFGYPYALGLMAVASCCCCSGSGGCAGFERSRATITRSRASAQPDRFDTAP